MAPGVHHALKGDEPGLVGYLFQSRRQPLLGELEVSAQQRRSYASGERVHASRAFSEPGLRRFFRAREIPAEDIEPLEVTGPSLWIHEPAMIVGDPRFWKSADMQTDPGHPVMGSLEIRSPGQYLFQSGHGLRVLKVLGRAPQDPGPRQVSLRQRRVQGEGTAAVVVRLLQPRALRI